MSRVAPDGLAWSLRHRRRVMEQPTRFIGMDVHKDTIVVAVTATGDVGKATACRDFQQAPSPVYGEHKVIIQYRVRDLLWRPAGRLVRFVAVIHPVRGACLLMCTDTSLDAFDIIRLYGLRFKIEHTFKQAV